MEEFNPTLIARRSVKGVFTFVTRTFFMQGVGAVAFTLYGAIFSTQEMGVYFLVSAVVDFLVYFSDVGLAASLIQKKEDITSDEVATTFTIQETLILIIVIGGFIFSQFVGSFYHLNKSGVFLFQALLVAFFLSSLKTIPSIILERTLQFEKLVIPELVETLLFYPTVLILAKEGFGVTSFTYAVLLRAIGGLLTIYIIAPWRIRIAFSMHAVKRLFAFGIPFQAISFIALLKDDLLTLYLGRALPLAQLGYIGFAQKWAFIPLRIFLDNISKIIFSSFSRLQHDTQALGKGFEKSLFAATGLIFPSLVGMVVLAPVIIHIVPKYQKWEPALFSLVFFGLNAILAAVLVPAITALNAIGKIKNTFYLMIGMTLAIWTLTPLFVIWYGFNGAAIASAAANLFAIPTVLLLKHYVPFRFLNSIKNPIYGAAIMGIVLYICTQFLPHTLFTLILFVLLGIISYFAVLFLFGKKELLSDIQFLKDNLRK